MILHLQLQRNQRNLTYLLQNIPRSLTCLPVPSSPSSLRDRSSQNNLTYLRIQNSQKFLNSLTFQKTRCSQKFLNSLTFLKNHCSQKYQNSLTFPSSPSSLRFLLVQNNPRNQKPMSNLNSQKYR